MKTRLHLPIPLLGVPVILCLGFCLWPLTDAVAATCSVPSASYPTIARAAGDATCTQINVAAGTYVEQVTLGGKAAVTLRGAGAGRTIIKSPATRKGSLQLTSYLPFYTYVVEVPPGGYARLSDLSIDGGGNATCAEHYFGVRFTSSQGALERVVVDNVEGSGTNFGCPNIYAVAATADLGGNAELAVRASTIRNFQTAGILVNGKDALATIENTEVRGAGAQAVQAQTGILFAHGGGGSSNRNNLSQLSYTGDPCKGIGTALASDAAAAVTYTANVAHDIDRGLWLHANTVEQTATGNRVTTALVGIVSTGNSPGKVVLTGNGISTIARSTAATAMTCFNDSGDGIAVHTEQKSLVKGNSVAGSARSAIELLSDTSSLDVQQNQTTGSSRYDLEDHGTSNHLDSNLCGTSSPASLCTGAP